MTYRSLFDCIRDLEKNGHLVRVTEEVDPDLEMAEVHRRVFRAGGPAIFFEKVARSPFPAVSNLFGTRERVHFLFRKTFKSLQRTLEYFADPAKLLKKPTAVPGLLGNAWKALPKRVFSAAVMQGETAISALPQIRCWPDDGGAFILLPQVYSEDPLRPGIFYSNLGMYRVQLSGNRYEPGREIGLHYQIARNIGAHHASAGQAKRPLPVSVFVGGPPAHSFAALMSLPARIPEIFFAGMLGGRRFRYKKWGDWKISAEADFCIIGYVEPGIMKPEGPFGDHLGYYSLIHPFPVIRVEKVYHRRRAIWPFTVVGRPPQEDSVLGALVHEIAGPLISRFVPGVKAVHAVDAAGVHPLLFALGSERYLPCAEVRPREILAQAQALLGFGPLSLAKYLMITDSLADGVPDLWDVKAFLTYMLERMDWSRDLHFVTQTFQDTLDYTGPSLHEGARVVMAAAGRPRRVLKGDLPTGLHLPEGFQHPVMALPGVLVIAAPPFENYKTEVRRLELFSQKIRWQTSEEAPALIVLVDDAAFAAEDLRNFLWVTFTRSDPARDIYGVGSVSHFKHWGCEGPLIIDARVKPHHAPVLESDPAISMRVDRLAAAGHSLHGIL
ncbi:MAG: UbiD family decarboxylase [Candidatus Omnitrophota bacterium]